MVCFIMTFLILVPKFYLGMPTVKLCLTNDFKQSLLSMRSQTGVWEREKRGGFIWKDETLSRKNGRQDIYSHAPHNAQQNRCY